VTNPDLLLTLEELQRHYKAPTHVSRTKARDRLTPDMHRWLAASPFFIIATNADDGIDCSARGDPAGEAFRVLDDRTIAIPDRQGNNRIDTLRNLIVDPRIGITFLTPGVEEALRIKGKASISVNRELLRSLAPVDGPTPATAIVISIESAHIQNARAINRAQLWG